MPRFRLSHNVTLLGAPGSGKGFYGRPLSEAWGVPLWTASTLLRTSPHAQDLLDSGRLVDCQIVSHTLVDSLRKQQKESSAFIMDGFPRTRRQIELMEQEWPSSLHVSHAVLLDVPEEVCVAKISGRRFCSKCKRHYNTMGYHEQGFDLPPIMPPSIPCDYDPSCNPDKDWQLRADDVDGDIVRERLRAHREHEQPIIDYYEQHGRLLRYTAYHGAKDLDDMRDTIEAWMQSLDK
eukprot:scaffold10861_cov180-Amphora_coffeaeformis.AAC.43